MVSMTSHQRPRVLVLCGSLTCGFAFLIFTLGSNRAAQPAASQSSGAPRIQIPDSTLPLSEGLSVVRTLLDAQVALLASGRNASLQEVLGQPEVASLKGEFTVIDSETASFKNYQLHLRSHLPRYEISLVPDKGCGLAFFVNEKDHIYVGQMLGCNEKSPVHNP
jgi:hypothetical protein